MDNRSRQEKINYLKKLLNQQEDDLTIYITEKGSDEVKMIRNGISTLISRTEYETKTDKNTDSVLIDFSLAM